MDNNKLKGTLNALKENKEEAISSSSEAETSLGIDSLMAPPEKKKGLRLKGIYLTPEQVRDIEKYSKKSKKSQSQFVREALDFVIGELKKNDY